MQKLIDINSLEYARSFTFWILWNVWTSSSVGNIFQHRLFEVMIFQRSMTGRGVNIEYTRCRASQFRCIETHPPLQWTSDVIWTQRYKFCEVQFIQYLEQVLDCTFNRREVLTLCAEFKFCCLRILSILKITQATYRSTRAC